MVEQRASHPTHWPLSDRTWPAPWLLTKLQAAAGRCQASEFSERGQLFMTPLIQALRTIVHLGETVPEAEQARAPGRHSLPEASDMWRSQCLAACTAPLLRCLHADLVLCDRQGCVCERHATHMPWWCQATS